MYIYLSRGFIMARVMFQIFFILYVKRKTCNKIKKILVINLKKEKYCRCNSIILTTRQLPTKCRFTRPGCKSNCNKCECIFQLLLVQFRAMKMFSFFILMFLKFKRYNMRPSLNNIFIHHPMNELINRSINQSIN